MGGPAKRKCKVIVGNENRVQIDGVNGIVGLCPWGGLEVRQILSDVIQPEKWKPRIGRDVRNSGFYGCTPFGLAADVMRVICGFMPDVVLFVGDHTLLNRDRFSVCRFMSAFDVGLNG